MFRMILTGLTFAIYSAVMALYSPVATLASGQAAGGQFAASDNAYLSSTYQMMFWSNNNKIITAIFLLAIILIWIGPVLSFIRKNFHENTLPVVLMGMILTTCAIWPRSANAYYDQKDFTEAYTILPNETAIFVPDIGNNKDSQTQLDSEAYLKSNQVSSKRFVVPHQKLSGSGSFYDYYVPAGRLYIVDRTTFSHEWVHGADRGTSKNDESFPCQSKEGINITVGVSIGASVKEENSAKYLYNFGVIPTAGDRKDPNVIFSSVYYSRKVSDVMGDVGRKKVQTLVCTEIFNRTFEMANSEAAKIMESVEQKATAYFASVGITLNFIGWADTFTFDPVVQKAINDRYAVDKLGSSVAILTALANLKVQEGLADGLRGHGLPMFVSENILTGLAGLAGKIVVPTTPPAAPAAPVSTQK